MKVLDLFSGIGGFSLGLERAGMQTVAFCEIEEFPRKVLKQHWPDVPIHEDIRLLDCEQYRGSVELICGGFPCQDLSVAGQQKGINASRSGLWKEFARVIGEIRPRYVVVENVAALLSGDCGRWFQRILSDLAALGYNAEWHCIPASELGAYHHRDRVWIIAHTDHTRLQEWQEFTQGQQPKQGRAARGKPASLCSNVSDTDRIGLQRFCEFEKGERARPQFFKGGEIARAYKENRAVGGVFHVEPGMGRMVNGIPNQVDRIKALGNAVVPQVVELIGHAIMQAELTR